MNSYQFLVPRRSLVSYSENASREKSFFSSAVRISLCAKRALLSAMLTPVEKIGSTKRPYYRIVVIDKRRARNGRFLEVLGKYNPIANPAQLEINADRAQYWLAKGAAPSETVRSILRKKELVK